MNILKAVIMGAAGLLSTGALAVPITEVGTYDELRASTTLNKSGDSAEKNWMEQIVGEVNDFTKLDSASGSSWEAVTDTGGSTILGAYAFFFGTDFTPDYFLVKVGDGKGTGTTDSHFLYENKNSDNWAFLKLSDFGDGVKLENVDVISHVASANGTVTVPEPGTLALLGLGLAGIGLSRRRRELR